MEVAPLVRSESRRRLPEPPSGVEPVTLQSTSGSNDPAQLEQRMAAIKQRVEGKTLSLIFTHTSRKTGEFFLHLHF